MNDPEKKPFSLGNEDNCAIKASAGSGKTFQLAMRFIALLFQNQKLDPAQIVAITFTRKAAAEIFNKIIDQLRAMIDDPKQLHANVANGLLPPELRQQDLPALLARILNSRTLQISTIDSFLVRILQAFPAEFGISGAVKMVDEVWDTGIPDTLLQVLQQEKEALLPLLRQYHAGKDPKKLYRALADFLHSTYENYLLYPDEALWGNLPLEDAERDAPLTAEERDRIFDTLEIGMEHYNYTDEIRRRFRGLMEAVKTHDCTALRPFFEVQEQTPGLAFRHRDKPRPISREMYAGVQRLYRFLAAEALRKEREKSQATYRILRKFDALYTAGVRSQGRLAFRDLPLLLGQLEPETKLDLEYRLDSRNLHYMLDEFQDTSSQQWAFLRNLMAEAIQGTEQSFFMVGDVKQSLYQWRQGNPHLFDSICRKYSLETRCSDRSFRSAPPVIATVNRVFGNPELQEERVQLAIKRMDFQEHTTARSDLPGYAVLLRTAADPDGNAKAAAVHRLLQTITPLQRGLSCAILVPRNDDVENYKQALRNLAPELPVSTEGRMYAAESMAYTFLTLLLRLAAHPVDAAARNALPLFAFNGAAPYTASGLADVLGIPGVQEWGGLASALRRLETEEGIAGIIRRFQAAFDAAMTAFDRERIGIAAQAAVNFHGSVDAFLAALEECSGNVESAEKTIQIMTIHKSKGLEFDVVILPELGWKRDGGGSRLKIEPMPETEREFSPSWVSYLPKSLFDPQLPRIAQWRAMLEEDQYYEKCCGLYVAMTRAKCGLYLLVEDKPNADGKNYRADLLLWNALAKTPEEEDGVLYETGDRQWFAKGEKQEKNVAAECFTPAAIRVCRPAAFHWHSPSRLHEEVPEPAEGPRTYADADFAPAQAAQLGSRIHAMFEAVEFWDNADLKKIRAICGDDAVGQEAWRIWNAATAAGGAIRQALMRPAGPCKVWRERNFLMQLEGDGGISGCFDRVLLQCNAAGGVERAVIGDYKSDALDSPEAFLERHALQLNAYRSALARMLRLPEDRIECQIYALRPNLVIAVPRN